MITEEEAIKRLWNNKSINSLSKVECDNLIKEIYKSFGSCKEYKFGKTDGLYKECKKEKR
jgi:hypothetical protein